MNIWNIRTIQVSSTLCTYHPDPSLIIPLPTCHRQPAYSIFWYHSDIVIYLYIFTLIIFNLVIFNSCRKFSFTVTPNYTDIKYKLYIYKYLQSFRGLRSIIKDFSYRKFQSYAFNITVYGLFLKGRP